MIRFSTVSNIKRAMRARLANRNKVSYVTLTDLKQTETEKNMMDAYNRKYPSSTKQVMTSMQSSIVKNLGQNQSTAKNRPNRGTASTVAKSALEKMVGGGSGESYSERMFAHTELFPQEERRRPEWGSQGKQVRIIGRQ